MTRRIYSFNTLPSPSGSFVPFSGMAIEGMLGTQMLLPDTHWQLNDTPTQFLYCFDSPSFTYNFETGGSSCNLTHIPVFEPGGTLPLRINAPNGRLLHTWSAGPADANGQLSLYSLQGVRIAQIQVDSDLRLTLPDGLQSGVYMARFTVDGEVRHLTKLFLP